MNKSRTLRATRLMILFVSAPHLVGCYTWEPTVVSPREAVNDERPGEVRVGVTDRDGSVRLKNPQIAGDSILGRRPRPFFPDAPERFALGDVQHMEVSRLDGKKTVLAILLGAAATAAISAMIGSAVGGESNRSSGATWNWCLFSC